MLNYDAVIDRYSVTCETFLDFGKIQLFDSIDPYGWFPWYFRYWKKRSFYDDEIKIGRDEIDKRFTVKLVKMMLK